MPTGGRGGLMVAAWVIVAAPDTAAAQVAPRSGDGGPSHARTRPVVMVVDSADLRPVAHATVRLARTGATLRLDGEGRAAMPALAMPDTLVLSAIGYRPLRVAVDTPPPPLWRLRLAPVPAAIGDLVVTGSRREQRLAELTLPVVVADRDELLAQGAAGIDEVVRELPGVQMLGAPPAGSNVMIRGMSDARVLVLIDGEPAAGAMLDSRDLSRISTAGVGRVEVQKGPASAVFGSDAIGGVVNIVTQAPGGPPEVELLTRAGQWGRREGTLTAQGGGRLAARATVGWRQQDRVPGIAETADALERVWDGNATVRYQVSERFRTRLDVRATRERQRWAGPGDFNDFTDTESVTAWGEGALQVGAGTWRTRVFGQQYRYQFRQARGEVPIAGLGAPPQRERLLRTTTAMTVPWVTHTIDAGIDLSFRDVDAPDRIVADQLADRVAEGYVQGTWRLGSVLATTAARHTWNSRWGTALTPSVGVAWDLSPRVRTRANVSRGFRGPSFKELGWTFANLAAGYVLRGNADLTPERSWQYAGGVTWAPLDRLVVDVDGFRNDVEGLIDLQSTGFTPDGLLVFGPRNVAAARTEGVEVGVRYTGAAWQVGLAYDWLRARDRELGLPLNRRATHVGRVRATRLWAGGLPGRLDATFRVTGAAPIVGTAIGGAQIGAGSGAGVSLLGTQAAFPALDLQLQVRMVRGVELSLGADNVLGARPEGWALAVQRRVFGGLRTTFAP